MDQQKRRELLDDVRQDILAAEEALANLRQVEAYIVAKLKSKGTVTGNGRTPSPPTSAPAPSQTAKTSVAGLTQADALEAVLRELGKPMRTMDLLSALIERGFPAPPAEKKQNLTNSLFSVMRRKSDRFAKHSKGLWGLVEWSRAATNKTG